MNEKELNRLADLIFDRIVERQEQADLEYHEQIQKLINNCYQTPVR